MAESVTITQVLSVVGFTPQGFNYRSVMDPVQGRCRRTDGKQWRCSRDVVPDQKYCERHMHRGRSGSRKHVEASEITSESVPLNLQLATTSSKSSGNPPAVTPRSTTSIGRDSSVEAKKDLTATAAAGSPTSSLTIYSKKSERNTNDFGNTITTTLTGPRSPADKKSNSRSSSDYVGENDTSYKNLNYRNNIRSSINNRDNVNTGSSAASGFGFPPDNVLRAVGCYSSSLDYNLRCRRTDGKKWRCNWDVVPSQKYCQRHLHRGAKKLVVTAQSVTVAAAPPPSPPPSGGCLVPPPLAIPKMADGHHVNVDTNLSISIVEASPVTNEAKRSNPSSSSSDATTITMKMAAFLTC
ncbi:growth-regulating factor 9-like isoform X3 [Actinidia eriantha]|uniref:growth-regulating factor 9-like isoform X3 n=1 Tax=Actinidia eriantha TaxID=165200 RepID=UPI00258F737A|nr:growth-regulating factor 9-like isoform X3 [Actinidia eriantha]XP_057495503.1 growth-regulating factor 9-like isoform X3 [Actinidia eriantha]XP_057495504.1 growth-regulating factor 9-like isoform X3 [Actinidia eriantha]